jgi:hypothetical protein
MYQQVIADNLSKAGWSLGYVSAVDSQGRTIWIADAHSGDSIILRLGSRTHVDDLCEMPHRD